MWCWASLCHTAPSKTTATDKMLLSQTRLNEKTFSISKHLAPFKSNFYQRSIAPVLRSLSWIRTPLTHSSVIIVLVYAGLTPQCLKQVHADKADVHTLPGLAHVQVCISLFSWKCHQQDDLLYDIVCYSKYPCPCTTRHPNQKKLDRVWK